MIHEKNAFFQKWGKLLLFAGYVLFFACIGWCSPITGDDLEFASLQYETLEEYWTYVSQYGNGRFLGNALGVAMSCLPLLRIWGRAVVLASCVMLLPRALGRDSFGDCWLSFLLLVGVDGKLFGEVYAWAAGFGNYITPIWLTLLILTLLTSRTDVHQGGDIENCADLPAGRLRPAVYGAYRSSESAAVAVCRSQELPEKGYLPLGGLGLAGRQPDRSGNHALRAESFLCSR